MRSVHGAVGTCPSLALHIADVHGNSLERTFLAISPPALPVPNCCLLNSPSLPWPPLSCSPLHPRAEIAAHSCFSSPRGANLLWPLGRGTLGTENEQLCCVPSTQTVAGEIPVQSSHRGDWVSQGKIWRAEQLCRMTMGLQVWAGSRAEQVCCHLWKCTLKVNRFTHLLFTEHFETAIPDLKKKQQKNNQHTKEFNKSLKCCIHKHSHASPSSFCLSGYMKARGCHGQLAKGCRSWPVIAPVNQPCTHLLPHSHLWKITFAAVPAEVAVLVGAAGTEHSALPSPDYF